MLRTFQMPLVYIFTNFELVFLVYGSNKIFYALTSVGPRSSVELEPE